MRSKEEMTWISLQIKETGSKAFPFYQKNFPVFSLTGLLKKTIMMIGA